ncbi:MAG: hypothetical protein VCC36_03455, partial [Gammaproteobacteria bacterium]
MTSWRADDTVAGHVTARWDPVLSDSLDDLFARYGPAYRWLATVTVLIAFFTMALSATIANVAVPDVMGTFGVGQDKA